MYLPLNYDKINIIEGTQIPSTQKTCNNLTFDYWVRTLFHRASSTLIFVLPTPVGPTIATINKNPPNS